MQENLFKMSVINKFRFPYKGLIYTEDLFDLSKTALDSIFKTLNAEVKRVKEESLMEGRTQEDSILEAKIEIVKYVFDMKVAEAKVALEAREKREQKQRILELIQTKKEAQTAEKSVEELEAMLETL